MSDFTITMNEEIKYCQRESHSSCSDTSEALDAIAQAEHWRSFADGLTELMSRCGYDGMDIADEKARFITEQFNKIQVKITPSTIRDWFSGKRIPDSANESSREKMYQLCFALNADAEQTAWFFEHVYFSRCFDYHRPNEIIYNFCMTHRLDYSTASSMIKSIRQSSEERPRYNMTYEIEQEVDRITTKEQLVDFISSNTKSFEKWNVTGRCEIKKLRNMLQDKSCHDNDELVRKLLKEGKSVTEYLPKCSLLIRWKFSSNGYCPDDILSGLQLDSVDFLLKLIMGSANGITKKSVRFNEIPDTIKKSFPNKKSLSEILDETKNVSYISVRKALIFLKFVHFWCCQELEPTEYLQDCHELFRVFVDEMNETLSRCGYSELYSGNPFDWIFLYSSTKESPLTFLGDILADLSETGE